LLAVFQSATNGEIFCGSALVNGSIESAPSLRQSSAGANVTQGDLLALSTTNFAESADNLTRTNRQLCDAFADNCTQAEIDDFGIVSFRWDGVAANRSQVFCIDAARISNATFFEFVDFPANFSGAVVVNVQVRWLLRRRRSAFTQPHCHSAH
jgi:choice-of-anchor A domain-containing protein